jgi:hypothetical protein
VLFSSCRKKHCTMTRPTRDFGSLHSSNFLQEIASLQHSCWVYNGKYWRNYRNFMSRIDHIACPLLLLQHSCSMRSLLHHSFMATKGITAGTLCLVLTVHYYFCSIPALCDRFCSIPSWRLKALLQELYASYWPSTTTSAAFLLYAIASASFLHGD